MKRPLALVLTIAILAAVAVCFLRPADPNPDFGNVPEVCREEQWIPITDCVGDTDKLVATEYSISTMGGVYVRLSSNADVMLTTHHYENGELVDRSGTQVDYGIVEKLVDGEWVSLGDIKQYVVMTALVRMEREPSINAEVVRPCECMKYAYGRQVATPDSEPGAKYRITHYFKAMEGMPHTEPSCESYTEDSAESYATYLKELVTRGTPKELYSITHTVSIPAASSKRFDLVDAGLRGNSSFGYIKPCIRVNYGDAPYIDLTQLKYEKREDGRWVDALQEDGTSAIVPHKVLGDNSTVRELVHEEGTSNYYVPQQLFLRAGAADPDADYRVTIVFAEHPDGSGEQYTLTLNLRFDELTKE